MRYFLSTKYTETPWSLQLISIGIVDGNGRAFYAENQSFDERKADTFAKKYIHPNLLWLWLKADREGEYSFWYTCRGKAVPDEEAESVFGPVSYIKNRLLHYFWNDPNPEIWGYYSAFDWVVFCGIFGMITDLPMGFPIYCRELMQLLDKNELDESDLKCLPPVEDNHNALNNALWNKALYEHLTEEKDG